MSAADLRTRARSTALGLWLVNLALACVLARGYLAQAPERSSLWSSAFVTLAAISTFAILSAPLCALFVAWASWLRAPRLALAVQIALWTAFQVLVYADTRIYALFRYHFNGMVWNLLTTPGGEDAFEVGPREWVPTVALALTWCAVQFVIARRVPFERVRLARLALLVCLPIVVADKALYAAAELRADRRVTVFSRVYPYYLPLTVKGVAQKWFGVQLETEPRLDLAAGSRVLAYPRAEPVLDPAAPRPNILIVLIDSLRADALEPRLMPNLARFAEGGRRFSDHLSGGNATRFGIFSLVYGIYGSYWNAAYGENCPPVLVRALSGAGYDLRVISSASMRYPEFRSTAWVTIPERVDDQFPEREAWQRDRHVARRFDEWLGERTARGAREPFFAFTLLDAPHQRYSFDPSDAPFQPCEESVDYLKLADTADAALKERIRNRYSNAVHFADGVFGEMLAALERRGELERTLVVVTGDHGEEFWESGFFGHTSNFTPAQTHVTFVMRGPSVVPGVETRPTSHLDLAPTLLELLGARADERGAWSMGENLFAPREHRLRAIAGWNEIALSCDDGILYVPLEDHAGSVEAYGADWKPLADRREFLARHAKDLAELARDCRRFLR